MTTAPKKPVAGENTGNKSTVSSTSAAEKVKDESTDPKAVSEPGAVGEAIDKEKGGNLDPEAQFMDPRPAADSDKPAETLAEAATAIGSRPVIQPVPDGVAVRPGSDGGVIDPLNAGGDPDDDEDEDPNGDLAPEDEVRHLAQNLKTGPVTATNNDGEEVIPSDEGPEEEISGFKPMHNSEGHRCAFINPEGKMTIMDDPTAAMFYDEPKFYAFVYDAAFGERRSTEVLRWCDRNGNATGGHPGDSYELGK